MKICLGTLILIAFKTCAAADPQIDSWFTMDSSKFAQIYRNDAAKFSGQTETTVTTNFVNQANATLTWNKGNGGYESK